MAQLTESIVDFLHSDRLLSPPSKSLETANLGFIDCVGVMLAGANSAVTNTLSRHIAAAGGPASSRILLGSKRASVAQATLVGVGSAHALDFDDYAYSNHVSALLVPAILAEAERTEASGGDMLRAYLAGFEVWGGVMKREPDHLHTKGWHPTGVFGPIGVAAALSRLRGLDADQTRNALGLAVANGGGVMDNFGTLAKSYQGARAAEAGVVCVELALQDMDAGAHAIDGTGGILAAVSPRGRADLENPASWLGEQWISAADSLNIKLHPTVGASQRCIDAAIQLHRDHAPDIGSVASITARTSEKHAAVMRFHRPQTALEAKFSLEFGVAAGLLAGKVGLAEVSDAFVAREDLQALMRRVKIEVLPDDDPDYPVGAMYDSVALEVSDGSTIESRPVRHFRGHGLNPLTEDELRAKFDECVTPAYGAAECATLYESIRDLEGLRGVDDIPVIAPSA